MLNTLDIVIAYLGSEALFYFQKKNQSLVLELQPLWWKKPCLPVDRHRHTISSLLAKITQYILCITPIFHIEREEIEACSIRLDCPFLNGLVYLKMMQYSVQLRSPSHLVTKIIKILFNKLQCNTMIRWFLFITTETVCRYSPVILYYRHLISC